jgi:hypothetical protein
MQRGPLTSGGSQVNATPDQHYHLTPWDQGTRPVLLLRVFFVARVPSSPHTASTPGSLCCVCSYFHREVRFCGRQSTPIYYSDRIEKKWQRKPLLATPLYHISPDIPNKELNGQPQGKDSSLDECLHMPLSLPTDTHQKEALC